MAEVITHGALSFRPVSVPSLKDASNVYYAAVLVMLKRPLCNYIIHFLVLHTLLYDPLSSEVAGCETTRPLLLP